MLLAMFRSVSGIPMAVSFSASSRLADEAAFMGCASYGGRGLDEDHGRIDNGSLARRATGLALAHGVSRQWKGYWQRAVSPREHRS